MDKSFCDMCGVPLNEGDVVSFTRAKDSSVSVGLVGGFASGNVQIYPIVLTYSKHSVLYDEIYKKGTSIFKITGCMKQFKAVKEEFKRNVNREEEEGDNE